MYANGSRRAYWGLGAQGSEAGIQPGHTTSYVHSPQSRLGWHSRSKRPLLERPHVIRPVAGLHVGNATSKNLNSLTRNRRRTYDDRDESLFRVDWTIVRRYRHRCLQPHVPRPRWARRTCIFSSSVHALNGSKLIESFRSARRTARLARRVCDRPCASLYRLRRSTISFVGSDFATAPAITRTARCMPAPTKASFGILCWNRCLRNRLSLLRIYASGMY